MPMTAEDFQSLAARVTEQHRAAKAEAREIASVIPPWQSGTRRHGPL